MIYLSLGMNICLLVFMWKLEKFVSKIDVVNAEHWKVHDEYQINTFDKRIFKKTDLAGKLIDYKEKLEAMEKYYGLTYTRICSENVYKKKWLQKFKDAW